MRKGCFLLSLFCFLTFNSFSQGGEDFTNNTAVGSYSDGFFVGNGGVTWNYTHARDEGSFPINGKGIILRRGKEPSSLSATFSGGIGSFSVNTRKAFKGNAKRKLELVINGNIVASHEPNFEVGEDTTIIPFVVNAINVPGDISLILRLYGAKGNQQITIDDIEWTEFSGNANPNLSIISPTEGEEFAPNAEVLLKFNALNFNISTAENGDGHVQYTIDGGTANKAFTSEPINLGILDAGLHTILIELVDGASNSLSPTVSKTVTFTIAPLIQVTNLGALRADVKEYSAGGYYEVMSVPTVTFIRSHKSQTYAQDTSAGILIDDLYEVITTEFTIGDGISALKGIATLNNDILHLIPIADVSVVASSDVSPEVVSIATLLTDFHDYESELVKIKGATFADAGGTFAASAIYSVYDDHTIDFRTSFDEVDYIGSAIPAATDLIVLVSHLNGKAQITARSMGDLLSILSFKSLRFNIYPNPTATGFVKIPSVNSSNISVEIFDVLGKSVIKKATLKNETLDVSRLKPGVYMLKIQQDNATINKKLIIE